MIEEITFQKDIDERLQINLKVFIDKLIKDAEPKHPLQLLQIVQTFKELSIKLQKNIVSYLQQHYSAFLLNIEKINQSKNHINSQEQPKPQFIENQNKSELTQFELIIQGIELILNKNILNLKEICIFLQDLKTDIQIFQIDSQKQSLSVNIQHSNLCQYQNIETEFDKLLLKKIEQPLYFSNFVDNQECYKNQLELTSTNEKISQSKIEIQEKNVKSLMSFIQQMQYLIHSSLSNPQIQTINDYRKEPEKEETEFLQNKQIQASSPIKVNCKYFWFLKMKKEQIKRHISSISVSERDLLRKQLQQMKQLVQEKAFDAQYTCQKHKKRVHYRRRIQYHKEKIYLCNFCILEIHSNNSNNQVQCKKHRKTINYKSNLQADSFQIFLCQDCNNNNNSKDTKTNVISQCHFQPITQICNEKYCIKNNQFLICSSCPQKHQNHDRTIYQKEPLMKYYLIEKQHDINIIQSKVSFIIQTLKLNPIVKLIDSYLRDNWFIIQFLKSFKVCNKDELQKYVQSILKTCQKEDMLILNGVKQLKKLTQQEKIKYLEVSSDLIMKQLDLLLKRTFEPLQQFQRGLKAILNLQKEYIDETLQQKYRQIREIQTDKNLIVSPCSLQQINLIFCSFVQSINIQKEREEKNDQLIQTMQKNKRTIFFQSMEPKILKQLKQLKQEQSDQNGQNDQYDQNINKQKEKSEIVVKKDLHEIYLQFAKENYRKDSNQLQILCEKAKQIPALEKIINNFKKQLQETKGYFRIKQKECFPLIQIIKNQFDNLRIIKIQYKQKIIQAQSHSFSDTFYYEISAYQLFKIIQTNKQLNQLSIVGVQILQFQQLMKLFNPKNRYDQQQKNLIWIRQTNLFHPLKLKLNTKIKFILQHAKNSISQKRDLLFFSRVFQSLSDITVKIVFRWRKINQLKKIFKSILKSFKAIKKLKLIIQIEGVTYGNNVVNAQLISYIKKLFKILSTFTQIIQLSFNYLSFDEGIDIEDFQNLEMSLNKIIHSNQITHLQLNQCNNFPVLPEIINLQSLNLRDVSFRKENYEYITRLIPTNKSLRFIKLWNIQQRWTIDQYLFNSLQYLIIKKCNSISMENKSLSLSCLKYLCIFQQSRGQVSFVQLIFPKLVKITHLILNGINFNHQIIQTILSDQLKYLHIQNNKQIKNYCLQVIDSKWPYISQILIKGCWRLTEGIFQICKFKGLREITTDKKLLGQKNEAIVYLKTRGIKVNY